MAILLYRVDERLVHGQVVIGWGSQLRPDRFIVVDDELSSSAWEQDLYRLGAAGLEVVFADAGTAVRSLPEWRSQTERTILLTRDISTMLTLARAGLLEGEAVNLGGIHYGAARDEVLPYLHLTEQDRADLRDIADAGATVSARDLPDAHRVALDALLRN